MTAPRFTTIRRPLTPQQRAILAFITGYLKSWGSSPTLHDLVDNCQLRSVDTARAHCQAIARRGYITFDATVERGIALVEAQS